MNTNELRPNQAAFLFSALQVIMVAATVYVFASAKYSPPAVSNGSRIRLLRMTISEGILLRSTADPTITASRAPGKISSPRIWSPR
jgi:hypothetical protein